MIDPKSSPERPTRAFPSRTNQGSSCTSRRARRCTASLVSGQDAAANNIQGNRGGLLRWGQEAVPLQRFAEERPRVCTAVQVAL